MVRGECPLRQGENVGAAAGLARQAELQHGRHARQLAHRRGGEERDQQPHRDRVTPGHAPLSSQQVLEPPRKLREVFTIFGEGPPLEPSPC